MMIGLTTQMDVQGQNTHSVNDVMILSATYFSLDQNSQGSDFLGDAASALATGGAEAAESALAEVAAATS